MISSIELLIAIATNYFKSKFKTYYILFGSNLITSLNDFLL